MSEEPAILEMKRAVEDYDAEAVKQAAEKAVQAGVDPVKAIEDGLAEPLRRIGDKFGKGEVFLTELIMAAEAMQSGLDVLRGEVLRRGGELRERGTVVVGTVAGDIHAIGKSIVAAMLTASGFNVIDLGEDVPAERFVEKVRESKADIVGLSALMTTTMLEQEKVVKELERAGLRDEVKVMVGGAPTSEEWAARIGADAYGADAIDAVKKAIELMEGRQGS